VLAVFAAIQRELGLPFDFPGSAAAFEARTQFTDLALLARAAEWMATEPRCSNQAFNVVNGDHPRWSELWLRFASWFGLVPGVPRALALAEYMRDQGAAWERVVAKHGLRHTGLDALASWPYGDYLFQPQWDVVSSMEKARSLGFHESVDSRAMFIRQFDNYRNERIIP
jgi:nucleoside-diphosphate-sugar epimerase